MEQEVKTLRDGGRTWREVASIMGISVTTAQRHYKQCPEFPKIHSGRIHRRVLNPRMMLVKIKDQVVPAVVKPGNWPQGKKVEIEQVDKKRYRIL